MVASFQAAYRSGSSSPTSSGSARSWWTLKKYLGIEIKRQPLCLVPDIRQNLVLKDHAFRVVLREPRFRGILVCEHLEVIRVANLLAGVDVDKNGHWSLFSLRLPKWDCLPDSSNGGGGGTRTQTQLPNEAANDPSALQNAALGSPTLVQVFLRPRGFGGQSARGRESTPGRTHRSWEVGKNMQSAAVSWMTVAAPIPSGLSSSSCFVLSWNDRSGNRDPVQAAPPLRPARAQGRGACPHHPEGNEGALRQCANN